MAKSAAVVGDITLDLVSGMLNSLPEEDKEVSTEFTAKLGGQAAHCALGLICLGHQVSLYGCIGRDPRSELIISKLKKQQHLDCHLQRKQKTALSIIALTPGKRTIFNDPGANALLKKADLNSTDAKYLFIGGIWHLKQLDLYQLFRQAKAKKMIILVDFGWTTKPDFRKIRLIFDQADYVFLNRQELLAFTGKKTVSEALKKVKPKLALHLGEQGAWFCHGGQIIRSASARVSVSDTTGAGDYWNAAFIHGLIRGWPMKKNLAFANKFAIRAIKKNFHSL